MPFRIVYFFDNFYAQINGVVTSSHNTIKEMARRGAEILVIAPKPAGKYTFDTAEWVREFGVKKLYLIPGIEAFIYPDFRFTPFYSHKIFAAVKRFKPDIIHFHSQVTLGLMGILIARKLKVPLVGTFHTFFAEPEYLANVGLLRFLGLHKSRLLVKLAWFINNKLFYENCTNIVTVSDHPKQALAEHGLPAEKINLVYNGLLIHEYMNVINKPNRFALPIELNPDTDYIVYVGRISIEKSLDILARAMKRVFATHPRTHWLVIGHGPYTRELKQLIHKLGISHKTTLTGAIPNHILMGSGLLARCKLIASASKSETQGLSLIEGMVFGLPGVGANARGIADVLSDGNGLLVEPDNPEAFAAAVCRLLDNRELYERISRKVRKTVHKYDIRKITDDMVKVYEKSLAAYPRAPDCRKLTE